MFKINCEDFDLEKIAESGQCFRMNETKDGKWLVLASDRMCLAFENEGSIIIECADEDNAFWHNYFDLDTDYSFYRRSADKKDAFLCAATEYGKGIRILNQDPWEMLITFIISQRKNIPAIKSCVEKICSKWGREIGEGIYAFPTPEELSKGSLDDLCSCSLGYRAEYIYLAAKAVSEGSLDLHSLAALSDDELFSELLKLKGVGIKVANCVLLFGFHRIAAFPVDVWIDRVQNQYYNGHFPVEKYEGYAGIMQQYIFYYARKK